MPDHYITIEGENYCSDSKIPNDINEYREKKIYGHGLMDIALFSANASQLIYVLGKGVGSETTSFYIITTLIIISLILQVIVAMLLIKSMQYTLSSARSREECYRWGSYIAYCTFLIAAVNVFIVSFGGSGALTDNAK